MHACRATRRTRLRNGSKRTALPPPSRACAGIYSDNLIEVVEWCMALDPLSRPQSVFALQKELSREGERRYTKLSVAEKVRLQFDTMVTDTKKSTKSIAASVIKPK